MNIETFFIFSQIVEAGSISRAADRLHISQPALTQQLKVLENQLGNTLLERSNKGVKLTPEGELVYQGARELNSVYQNLLRELDSLKSTGQKLRVVATPQVYSYALPCTLFDIKKKFPDILLEVTSARSDAIETMLIKHESDIGFIIGEPTAYKGVVKKVYTDQVLLTAGSEFQTKTHLHPEDLYEQPLLMLTASHKARRLLDQELTRLGLDLARLQIVYDFDSTESVKQSAVNGFGLAFLPYISIKKELYNKQLQIIDLEGFQYESNFYLLKSEKNALSGELAKLVSYLEKTLERTIC